MKKYTPTKRLYKFFGLIALAVISPLIQQCTTFAPQKIYYQADKEFFEYQANPDLSIALRNRDLELVDSSNIEEFYEELAFIHNRYPFDERFENDDIMRISDYRLSNNYSKANKCIREGNYDKALDLENCVQKIYPNSDKYTDILFLKAHTYEKLGRDSLASRYYEQFHRKSGQKYTLRFRGYRDFNINDSIFIAQRKYASARLKGSEAAIDSSFFVDFQPQYYYGSFQPGYGLNPEDFSRHSRYYELLSVGRNSMNNYTLGFQHYQNIWKMIDINVGVEASLEKSFGGNIAVPVQLYCTKNKNFAVKLTPFVSFNWMDSIMVNDIAYNAQEGIFNFGARISSSFYFAPSLSIGAYYQYNFYNENNQKTFSKNPCTYYQENEYDVSLYYNFVKGFSLKGGLKNNDLVLGLFITGWEISYDFTNPGIVLRTNLY